MSKLRKLVDRQADLIQANGRNFRLRHTFDELEAVYKTYNGHCAICNGESRRKLVLDHCHATGKLRGFLCSPCNTGLGMFKDKPEVLLAAAEYLAKHKE